MDEPNNILCSMGFEYNKISACPNDCVLCRDEFVTLKMYSTCGLYG